MTSLRPILERHRVEILSTVKFQPLADPPRLRQILEHLVENAVKYAPPETSIRIEWSLNEGVVQLGVSDEGPASPTSGASGSSSPMPGATPTRPAARGSGCTPPNDSVSPWAPTCGANRPDRMGRASSSLCRP